MTPFHSLNPHQWAQQHFGDVTLGDQRRNSRVVSYAAKVAGQPGLSIPQLSATFYETKAIYNLFKRPEATPDKLQAAHRQQVCQAMQAPGTYLLIEDDSHVLWRRPQPAEGLSYVSDSTVFKNGVILHSVLAVQWKSEKRTGQVLGLLHQEYYLRQLKPATEADHDSKGRLKRQRESIMWFNSEKNMPSPKCPESRFVRVADRAADIFEFMLHSQQNGWGFVVRASQNRSICGHRDPSSQKLFQHLRQQKSLGNFHFSLRSRGAQPQRTVQMQVSATPVELVAPQRPGVLRGKRPPVACWAVRAWERDPPAGVAPLEWMLLTDKVITSFGDAREVVAQYQTRWLIEEFHKCLKSGLKVEGLQLDHAQRLFAAMSILSVVATRLLALKQNARLHAAGSPTDLGLQEDEIRVLAFKTGRKIQTAGEALMALGRLGGHLNRKGDGSPGWITLWRGWCYLQNLMEGLHLAQSLSG